MDELEPLPRQVALHVERLSGTVPTHGELRQPGGQKPVVKEFSALDAAECEQLVERHMRGARNAIYRYRRTHNMQTAATAAEHIVKTPAFQERREQLLVTGSESPTAPSETGEAYGKMDH
jgi:hypothetical protein